MIKKLGLTTIIFLILTFLSMTANSIPVQAVCTTSGPTCLAKDAYCKPGDDCIVGFACQQDSGSRTGYSCKQASVSSFFGNIQPPEALKNFIGTDTTGASGISKFLSNGIILIYSLATIVLIFMLLWGAFEWLTSGGDKEAIAKARGRIINAIIGILLFAVAFAIIQVLGQFTGFKFFVGQQ